MSKAQSIEFFFFYQIRAYNVRNFNAIHSHTVLYVQMLMWAIYHSIEPAMQYLLTVWRNLECHLNSIS